MGGVDEELVGKFERKVVKTNKEQKQKQNEINRKIREKENIKPTDGETEITQNKRKRLDEDKIFEPSSKRPKAGSIKEGTTVFIPYNILESLSPQTARAQIHPNKTNLIVSALINQCGGDLNKISLSTSTGRRMAVAGRKKQYMDNQNNTTFPPFCSVHYDGKLMKDLGKTSTTGKVDRTAVIVSGGGQRELLAIPKSKKGTGEKIKQSVVEGLERNEKLLANSKIVSKLYRYHCR